MIFVMNVSPCMQMALTAVANAPVWLVVRRLTTKTGGI
jgi:hypothetical protein